MERHSLKQIIKLLSERKISEEELVKYYYSRIEKYNPTLNAVVSLRNIDQVFINNVEDFQVVLKDKDGNELTEVNNLAGNPGKEKQSKVKTIEIYLTVKSNNKIYKSNKTWEIKNADRSYTKVDQYHRDTYFVSVYPRNLVKN